MKKIILLTTALVLMLAILWFTDLSGVISHLNMVNLQTIILLCLMQMATILLINVQWHKIASHMGVRTTLRTIFHINMYGTFAESITPSVKAGGEAVKVYMLRSKIGIPISKAAAIVLMQKTVSLLSFFAVNAAGFAWFFTTIQIDSLYVKILTNSLLFLSLCLVCLLLIMICPDTVFFVIRFLPFTQKLEKKVEKGIRTFKEAVQTAAQQRRALFDQLILSLLIWIFFAVKSYIIARSIHIELSFPSIAVVTFLTYMVGMLPLLPGGLGTFEGSMIFLLNPLGVPYHQGLALALVLRFITFWFVFLLSAVYVGWYYMRKSHGNPYLFANGQDPAELHAHPGPGKSEEDEDLTPTPLT